MKFFGLIVARSGSRGVPGKNILSFNGKPLLQLVSEAMLSSGQVMQTIISTDSEKYGEVARKVGVSFNWLRPDKLASDDASVTDVIRHAISAEEMLENGFTHIVLVQPSSPLVNKNDIIEAVDLIKSRRYDSAVSATEYNDSTINYLFYEADGYCEWLNESGAFGNRQNLPKVYKRCGNVYCFDIRKFLKLNRVSCERCGYVLIPKERSLCIDTHDDIITLSKQGEVQYGR
jgi:CMP-N,N'-diacetyllegionaminic acid synthase